jgi:chromosome segregation ATPase
MAQCKTSSIHSRICTGAVGIYCQAFLMCYNRRNSIRVRSAREGGMDDLTQVTQMINWLESERRKDKAALATLEQKASGLANELAEQTRRVQELQTALTATQLALSKLPQFEKILEQFKTDLIGEMDRRDDAQQKSAREAERLRKVELESIGRIITEIRKELPRIKLLEDELPMRRAEDRRLGEVLSRVSQRLDELAVRTEDRVQSVIYLEENRRQDAKRIAELEADITNFAKRLDTMSGKVTLLDENVQRVPLRLGEFQKRLQEQDKTVEELRVNDFHRAQDMRTFADEVTKTVAPIPDYLARYQVDSQKMQEMAIVSQRSIEESKNFQVRLETRQGELGEMQRINEERIKKQIEEWQAEQEKRWKRELVHWTEQWTEHDRVHASWETRLEAVEHVLPEHTRQLKAVWDGLEELPKAYLAAVRQIVEVQQAWLDDGRPSRPVISANNRAAVEQSSSQG